MALPTTVMYPTDPINAAPPSTSEFTGNFSSYNNPNISAEYIIPAGTDEMTRGSPAKTMSLSWRMESVSENSSDLFVIPSENSRAVVINISPMIRAGIHVFIFILPCSSSFRPAGILSNNNSAPLKPHSQPAIPSGEAAIRSLNQCTHFNGINLRMIRAIRNCFLLRNPPNL